MIERLNRRNVVLLGIGHTNAHILRMWKMNALPDTNLICISNFSIATYSGMLPAVLAGQIPVERMQIDLVQLCARSGAQLILDAVTGLNHQRRELEFAVRPPLPFDVMSIGVGSTASLAGVDLQSDRLVQIKPMQTFLTRLLDTVKTLPQTDQPLHVAVVGSGVAGIEITCCLPELLRRHFNREVVVQLVTRSATILPAMNARARKLVEQELLDRDVVISTKRSVNKVTVDRVHFEEGDSVQADVVIWATNASPPPIVDCLGLDQDERGFIATDNTLQTSLNGVFAVGDTGTIVSEGLPKAGVYAVRQGPVLWENIQRTLNDRPLERYRPQRSFLKLLNLGDGRAVAEWKALAASGRWAMRWKERIDGRFMDMFQMSEPMTMEADDMQCRGCGCKLGADILDSALIKNPDAPLDDAAEIGGAGGNRLLASTDFFSAPFEDAFLTGRVIALHSASDIVASGAVATEALANVVLPDGHPRVQQRTLADLLAGARLEFSAMGAEIVGGHTIVGRRMEVGFTVIGRPLGETLLHKGSLQAGDELFVTKPIGIGVLLAAHMRSRCPAAAYEAVIAAMLQRQHELARIAIDAGITAGTDITGFGLAGHLIEMLMASDLSGTIELQKIPTLPGAMELVEQGIESTLAPDNRSFECHIEHQDLQSLPAYKLLFDPQTCGGMLLGVAQQHIEPFLSAMKAAGQPRPTSIGTVKQKESARLIVRQSSLQGGS